MIEVITFINNIFFVLPRVLLNRFFPPFTVFEQKLLEQIVGLVPQEYSVLLKEHLREVNCVYRNGGDRQIIFSKFYFYKMIWSRSHYFEPCEGEHKLLRFEISFATGEVLNGTLITVDGVLLGMNFGSYADDYRKRTDFTVKVRTHFGKVSGTDRVK